MKLSGRKSRAPEAGKPIGDADKRLLATVADVCKRLNDPAPVFWRAYDVIQETLGEGEILSTLVTCEIPEYMGRQTENKVERELDAENDRTKRIEGWKNGQSLLRSGAGNLDHAAMVYFGFVADLERKWSKENLQNHFNAEISASIIAGFKRRAEIGLNVPMSELGRFRAQQSRNCMETAIVAAVSIYLKERDFEALEKLPLEAAFLVLLNWSFCDDEEHCSQLKGWAHSKLDGDSERASDLLVSFWLDELDARVALKQGDDILDINLVHDFSDGERKSKTASLALSKLFDKRHDFPPKVLRSLVRTTVHQWPVGKILKICKSVISDKAVSKENRQIWMVVAFVISPHGLSKQLQSLFAKDRKALAELSDVTETVIKSFPLSGTHDKLAYHVAKVEILGPEFPPTGDMFGPRDTVQHSINSLAEILDQEANKALIRLCNLPLLKDWESNLRHAISTNLKMIRDNTFNHPTVKQIRCLSNKLSADFMQRL